MRKARHLVAFAVLAAATAQPAAAETKEEWIALGARVHGAFGAFIPVGIRIGLDAKERIKADPRGLTVTFWNGNAPCPCVADGVMLATHSSPGQGTLKIAPEPAPAGTMAVIAITDRKTGNGFKYTIAAKWLPEILGWNPTFDPSGRYDAAMAAQDLFAIEPINAAK
jgi:formylmethanofuran dehydrogenase subunit E